MTLGRVGRLAILIVMTSLLGSGPAGWSSPPPVLEAALRAPAHPAARPASGPWQTLRAATIPATTEVPNTGKGMYDWLGVAAPPGWPVRDVYYRDQVNWAVLEPTQGSYDFRPIDQGLRAAASNGGRFGFRVMAYSPGYGDDVAPAYLPRQANGAPDWNDERWLAGWERLWAAIGTRYGSNARIGWVDVGGYGSWGEWHSYGMPQGTAPITVPNAQRVIAAVLNAFPQTHVVINASDRSLAEMALAYSPRLGLRVDCLGQPEGMWSALPKSPLLQARWRTQPVIGEWCNDAATDAMVGAQQVKQFHFSSVSSGNYPVTYANMTQPEQAAFLGAAQAAGFRLSLAEVRLPARVRAGTTAAVRFTWRNAGAAPTYDPWEVQLNWERRGVVKGATQLRTQLSRVLPGQRRITERLRLPALRPGRYQLRVRVLDPRAEVASMALANADGNGNGYLLGSVRID